MRICFFIESLFHGAGTERITVDVANALAERGYDIEFILLNKNITSFYSLNSRIKVHTIEVVFKDKLRAIIKLRQFLKRKKPDYIVNVAFQMSIISLVSVIGLKVKVITWEHFYLRSGSFLAYIMRLISALYSYRQVVLTKSDLKNYPCFLQKKLVCIPNFTCLNSRSLRSCDSKIVLSVGRLNKSKGFDLLIKAWARVASIHTDWKLYIVGEGGEKEKLMNQIHSLNMNDSVKILPVTSNILDYYLHSGFYVMSSRFEPFGLVLIEAKSCGLPVIAFDCPFGPKNIIRNGIDGFLVKPFDEIEFSEKIIRLINDKELREKMGKLAILDFEENWSKSVLIQKWIDLFV